MAKHLQRDLGELKKELLASGSLVEEALNHSIEALVNRRINLAEVVIEGDYQINQMENQIEEECLKILALHQPVAADLRFIISIKSK
jgi:phosphate transport system protein